MNNVTSSYVDLENSLGSGDIKVTYRIDNGKSVTEIWGISNRHDSVGRWNSGDSIPFIKGLLKKNSIFFEIAPYISTRFDVKGLEEAVKPLRKACGW
jgi:type VI secretion system protein VasI